MPARYAELICKEISMIRTAWLAGAALCLGALPAQSQQLLDKADENRDGVITRAEYQTSRVKAFAKLDRNDDGFIDASDAPKRRRPRNEGTGARMAALRDQLDDNADQRISREEFAQSPLLLFDRADTDHDGKLIPAEIEALKEAMKKAKAARS
jgi:hypothetical protein